MKKIASIILASLLFTVNAAHGQDAEMADGMRSSGKIYVVIGIILIVLIGLITYLFMTDKKLTRIEKQLQSDKPKSL